VARSSLENALNYFIKKEEKIITSLNDDSDDDDTGSVREE
jgi:hypothetical protein